MNCSRCGNATEENAPACGSCAAARSGFWWTVYSALLLVTVGVVDAVFLRTTVPRLAQSFHGANQALPLSLRVLISSSSIGVSLAPWLVIAAILVVVVIRRKGISVPSFAKNGMILAIVAWLIVTGTLVALTLTAGHLRPAG